MSASTMVLTAVFPINLGLNIALVHHTSLDLLGAPLALSITYWLMFILLVLYACLSPTRQKNDSWAGFDFRAIADPQSSWQFLKLALPGVRVHVAEQLHDTEIIAQILMVGTECGLCRGALMRWKLTELQGRLLRS
jgi:Na+-driven multidrug efflux pump